MTNPLPPFDAEKFVREFFGSEYKTMPEWEKRLVRAGYNHGLRVMNEAAVKVAYDSECQRQRVCCKLQLWAVGQDIKALLPAEPTGESDD